MSAMFTFSMVTQGALPFKLFSRMPKLHMHQESGQSTPAKCKLLGLDQLFLYATISSDSSTISSTISSMTWSSLSSVFLIKPSVGSSGKPSSLLSAFTSSSHISLQANHSLRSLRLCSTTAKSAEDSRSASSWSKVLLYSRRFLRICFCSSLVRRDAGRGRHSHCLNLSTGSSRSCSPLKSYRW